MLLIFTLFVCFLYEAFLLICLYYWKKTEETSQKPFIFNSIQTAVIIPVRNEAENISTLLSSLAVQDYSHERIEIIVVDDHSSDHTKEVAENFFRTNPSVNGKCLSSPDYSKKKAIEFAVKHTEAELILTTDGDTSMGKEWISAMVNHFGRSGSFMICGPVRIRGDKRFLNLLQEAEIVGLNVISAAGIQFKKPMMCNGANLAFTRRAFQEVDGYAGSKSDSGDDTQLLLKIHKKYPDKISWVKDLRAIVETKAMDSAGKAWSQRRRWASKIPTTLTPFTIFIAILAWVVHAALLTGLILAVCVSINKTLVAAFVLKIIPEIFLIRSAGKFFDKRIPIWLFFVAQPVYMFYIVLTGLLIPFVTYWKGRSIS